LKEVQDMADSMRPTVASVVGHATDTHWGQVLSTPHAYGVVEIHAPDGIARTRGIQLLTKLTRIFDVRPISLSALVDIADTVTQEDVSSLILLVPVGSMLYLVSRGNGCVFLKRENKLAKLLEGTGSLSGDIRQGDTIIAATEGFIRALSQEEIIGVFDHLSPEEVAEKLTIRLHEREGGEGGSALIFRMGATLIGAEERIEKVEVGRLRPPLSGHTIFLRGAKSFGRRITTVKSRATIRQLIRRMKTNPFFSPKHLITYLILTLFIMSVVLGVRRQQTARVQSSFTNTIAEARHSFDEGMALLELNSVKGRERLTLARDTLVPIVSKKLRSNEARQAKELYDEVVKNLAQAMHVVQVTPELFFDMGLLKKDAIAFDIALFENTIGILDARGKTAYTLGVASKNSTIVGGGQAFEGALCVAAYGDKLYVWTPGGVHEIRLSDQKTGVNIVPASSEWGTVADMSAFGGNLYLLDTQKSRIWKYVATEKGFSTIFEYLNPDTLPDLSHATNMAIDGSVWLGTNTGSILRFTSGKENSFTPQGVDMPLGKNLRVYTHDDAKMVYVLDTANSRVVVFDKEGLYISQYMWKPGFVPTGLVVAEGAGKLFLLADGKIYAVDLK